KGQKAIYGRAAAYLPAVDLAAQHRDLETTLRRPVSERELSSWLLFPALFYDCARHRDRFGDVSVLATAASPDGLQRGEGFDTDVAVALRPGQLVARGDTLLAIEAMKMETRVIAERDAMIAEVYVTPGETVGPSDLLVLLS